MLYRHKYFSPAVILTVQNNTQSLLNNSEIWTQGNLARSSAHTAEALQDENQCVSWAGLLPGYSGEDSTFQVFTSCWQNSVACGYRTEIPISLIYSLLYL